MIRYRGEIDGLRAVAVISVILFHAGVPQCRGGFVGVDIFFVISGYLITGILLRELREGSFSIASFYERRVRRILPALFTMILCCFPFAWAWLLPQEFDDFCKSVLATTCFGSNFWFAGQQNYFASDAELNPLLHTWSLAVEEQYYIFFPLLLGLVWRFGLRAIGLLILILAGASFLLIDTPFGFDRSALFFLTWTRAWEILLGALCGLVHFQYGQRPHQVGSAVGLLLILYSILAFGGEMKFPSAAALIPTAGAGLCLLFASETTVVGRILSMPPMVGIGLISYSAYLWHQPMFAFYRLQFAPSASLPAMLLLSALSLAIGWLSWRFVENPFRSRVRVPWKQVALMMTAAAALVMLLPALALKGGAGMARFDPEDQVIMAQMMTKPATSYVAKRFNARKLKDFDPSKRLKLLIIGDSYAQDLVNALCECGIDKDISISTNYISARCGNLCVPYDLSSYWESGDRALCESTVGYQNQRLLELIRAANVVLLVSNWRTWQAPLVPESLRNIQALTEATVVVVGRKRFGRSGDVRFDPRTFLHRSDAEKAALRTYLNDEDLTVNRQMKQSLPPANYLDFQEAVSRDGTSSPLFDEELNLISFDGSHLTKTGALFVGKRLLENPLMRSLLKLDDRR